MSDATTAPVPPDLCCDTMREATGPYSDAEGWGKLVWILDGVPKLASCDASLSEIKFCPWCGTAVGSPAADKPHFP